MSDKITASASIGPSILTSDGKVIKVDVTYFVMPQYCNDEALARPVKCTAIDLRHRYWIGQALSGGVVESQSEEKYKVSAYRDRVFSSRREILARLLRQAKSAHRNSVRDLKPSKHDHAQVRKAEKTLRQLTRRFARSK